MTEFTNMLFEGQFAVNFNTQKCDCVFRGTAVIFEADLYSSGVLSRFCQNNCLKFMELELKQSNLNKQLNLICLSMNRPALELFH